MAWEHAGDAHREPLRHSGGESQGGAEVIRVAYKSLMQRHHPDKSVNGSESTPLASSIALAYEVLSDPQRRMAYD
jgi:DnaJ-class molecular chaperone